jgi:threonylcarbamoyladenosine tRNA methylthiotransferase MtaB
MIYEVFMKVYFITFGCKVNIYETEVMKNTFRQNGYIVSDNEKDSDIFVINSCTVTSYSDKKIRQTIHRLKRNYPLSIIVLTGCYPQAFSDDAGKITEADIVTGTKNRNSICSLVEEYINNKNKVISICEHQNTEKFEDMVNTSYADKTRAFVKIQDGCNMFCSYCIIPYSRGRFRSKPLDRLKEEIKLLAENGYKEIVLVGINLSFYGIEYGLRLADAIEAVCAADGIERVRLGSLEPEVINDEDIKRMSAQKKLCPQFHLSLQSGCDRTLKAMNRRYTVSEYRKLVEKLRSSFPDCSVTTDIMVGFPGETEDDFYQSLEFVKSIEFSAAHIFPYSPRKGTPAAEMKNQVSEKVKTERAELMTQVTDLSKKKFLLSQLGNVYPVLFEKEKNDYEHHGYTPNYTKVKILTENSEKSLRSKVFYVKIIGLENDYCLGDIVNYN